MPKSTTLLDAPIRFFKSLATRVNTRHKAELESPMWIPYPLGVSKSATQSTIRERVLKNPEIFGRMMRIVDDIVSSYELVSENKALKERGELYCTKNNFIDLLKSALFDELLAGDGYLEPVSVKESQANTLVTSAFESLVESKMLRKDFDVSEKARAIIQGSKLAKLFEPSELWWVDQQWIYKEVDKHGRLIRHLQRIRYGSPSAEWLPGELINLSGMRISNEVYGFTPLSIVFNDLETLEDLKSFIGNFFKNNGVPDFLINIKNATPNDENVKGFVKEFKKRREGKERGSMIITGDTTVEELTKVRDMDFPKLIEYLGFILDMTWGIPPQVNAINASSTRTIDTFLAPYYNKVRAKQKKLEDVLNLQLFGLFGTEAGQLKIKFNNPYLRDATRNVAWATVMHKDGQLSGSEYREVMGRPSILPDDFEDNPYRQQLNFGTDNSPFNGLPADNRVNGDKNPDKEDEDPKDTVKRLGLKKGVNYK